MRRSSWRPTACSLSKQHEAQPYVVEHAEQRFEVGYAPTDSPIRTFGGNSNWRGPIWLPMNALLIDSLREFHRYYGEEFRVECPTGSGQFLHLGAVADELARRLSRLFLRGRTAVARRWAMGRTTRGCYSTSSSTATTDAAWAPPIRLAGQRSSPCWCAMAGEAEAARDNDHHAGASL